MMKKLIKEAIQTQLCEAVVMNGKITKTDKKNTVKFIKEDATYEQLLNMAYNTKYSQGIVVESAVLEGVFLNQVSSMMGLNKVGKKSVTESITESLALMERAPHYDASAATKVNGYQKYSSARQRARSDSTSGQSTISGVMDYIVQKGQEAQKFFSSAKGKDVLYKGTIAVLGAAALGSVAVFLYKRYFSAAARACKGKSGDAFHKCVYEYQAKACDQVIAQLKKDMGKCKSGDKNSEKCTARYQAQIKRWEGKKAKAVAKAKTYSK